MGYVVLTGRLVIVHANIYEGCPAVSRPGAGHIISGSLQGRPTDFRLLQPCLLQHLIWLRSAHAGSLGSNHARSMTSKHCLRMSVGPGFTGSDVIDRAFTSVLPSRLLERVGSCETSVGWVRRPAVTSRVFVEMSCRVQPLPPFGVGFVEVQLGPWAVMWIVIVQLSNRFSLPLVLTWPVDTLRIFWIVNRPPRENSWSAPKKAVQCLLVVYWVYCRPGFIAAPGSSCFPPEDRRTTPARTPDEDAMGIGRDSRHKHYKTGGRSKTSIKKRKYEPCRSKTLLGERVCLEKIWERRPKEAVPRAWQCLSGLSWEVKWTWWIWHPMGSWCLGVVGKLGLLQEEFHSLLDGFIDRSTGFGVILKRSAQVLRDLEDGCYWRRETYLVELIEPPGKERATNCFEPTGLGVAIDMFR